MWLCYADGVIHPPAFVPSVSVDDVISAACAGVVPNDAVAEHYAEASEIMSLDTVCERSMAARLSPVYVAGPMTGYDGYNYETFHAVSYALRARGITVVSPAEATPGVYAPVSESVVGTLTPEMHAAYLRRGFSQLMLCRSVVLLPGWQHSHGAQYELHLAYVHGGIEVFRLHSDVVGAARTEFER